MSVTTARADRLIWDFLRHCQRASSGWKAECTATDGSFSAYRENSVRAICCTAEKHTTMTVHGRIRIITTNSTAFSLTAREPTPMGPASQPVPTMELGTQAIKLQRMPYPSLVSSAH